MLKVLLHYSTNIASYIFPQKSLLLVDENDPSIAIFPFIAFYFVKQKKKEQIIEK